MDKKFINQQKEKLLKAQKDLEKALLGMGAKKQGKEDAMRLPPLPKFDGSLEEEADQVEEYGTMLSIDYVLKKELGKTKAALDRIKQGNYGVCEKCKKPITKQRLSVYPQAQHCKKCQ